MLIRPVVTKEDVSRRDPSYLRERLVIEDLFQINKVSWVQSHHDRILLGGVRLQNSSVSLSSPDDFGSSYLLERRELGLACLSESVEVKVDGEIFRLESEDILYIGKGSREISIKGSGLLYISSSMAHESFPNSLVSKAQAETIEIGSQSNSNLRTLRKYIHDKGSPSCSMAMGITTLHPGNVWNTMPCHVHERRTEAYLYFDLAAEESVIHLFGEPQQTRNFVLGNLSAVISPAWSIHTGAGTSNYKFVWSTAGENITYSDFVPVKTSELR